MKKLVLLAITGIAAMNLVVATPEASEADQKWLAAVEKMVAKGEKSISTPVEARTQLAKDWAKKNGYSVTVTKIGSSYRLEFSKALAKS